jgi:hypothetical protein
MPRPPRPGPTSRRCVDSSNDQPQPRRTRHDCSESPGLSAIEHPWPRESDPQPCNYIALIQLASATTCPKSYSDPDPRGPVDARARPRLHESSRNEHGVVGMVHDSMAPRISTSSSACRLVLVLSLIISTYPGPSSRGRRQGPILG